MATGAAGGDGLFRGVFEGCIGVNDTGIQRRPYHRNCSCALHKSRGHCAHASRHSNISYPIRRTWSEGCLSLMAASSGHSSPCSSPVATVEVLARTPAFLSSEGEQESDISCKVRTHAQQIERELRKREMTSGAAEIIFGCITVASISTYNMEVKRRPYHRNCSCALHSLEDVCSNSCPRHKSISFPKKRSWSKCFMTIDTSNLSSPFHSSSSLGT